MAARAPGGAAVAARLRGRFATRDGLDAITVGRTLRRRCPFRSPSTGRAGPLRRTRSPRSTPSSAPPSSTASAMRAATSRPAARHRRRGLGQDEHARASRRAPRARRRRPAAHPAADVLAPRGAARWSGASARVLQQALGLAATQRAASLPWAGTFHSDRRAPAARVRAAHRPGPNRSRSTTAATPRT